MLSSSKRQAQVLDHVPCGKAVSVVIGGRDVCHDTLSWERMVADVLAKHPNISRLRLGVAQQSTLLL